MGARNKVGSSNGHHSSNECDNKSKEKYFKDSKRGGFSGKGYARGSNFNKQRGYEDECGAKVTSRSTSLVFNDERRQNKIPIDLTLSDEAVADSASRNTFKVNKNYASRYQRWRSLEESAKMKAKYGIDVGDEDDDMTSEDEEGNRLPPEFDKEFLVALSCIKSKDPKIYDSETQFFKNLDVVDLKKAHANKEKKEKPFLLKDYDREILLNNENGIEDEEEDNKQLKSELHVGEDTYVEEQRKIKESFKQIVADSDSDDGANLLTQRKKTDKEVLEEDNTYFSWLKGQKEHINEREVEKDILYLKEAWNNESLPEDERFLRDFIVDKKYVHHSDDEDAQPKLYLSDDEDIGKEREQFESKYNFRFEEPDQEFIKHYPRLMTTTMRTKDPRRKENRKKGRENKIKKKERINQELMRIKAIKRKEITEKLEKIKQITGNMNVGLEASDIIGNFDAESYDKRMNELFNDEYYGCNADGEDEEKPEFSEDDDYENWDEWQGGNEEIEIEGKPYEPHCEDPDFNMDCENYNAKADFQEEMKNLSRRKRRKLSKLGKALQQKKPVFDPNDYENWDEWQGGNEEIEIEGKPYEPHCEDPDFNMDCENHNAKADFQEEMKNLSRRKRRKLSKLGKALQQKKPVFDPKEKTFEKYFDEYYNLEYEDIIEDLPCRFKYRKVLENDFGLSVEEILSAEDRELNAWCSLKKATQYCSKEEEMKSLNAYQQKGRCFWKKKKILKSVYAIDIENEDKNNVDEETKIKKRKGTDKKIGNAAAVAASPVRKIETEELSRMEKRNKSKHRKDNVGKQEATKADRNGKSRKHKTIKIGIADSRLKAFGLNPYKYKKSTIYRKRNN